MSFFQEGSEANSPGTKSNVSASEKHSYLTFPRLLYGSALTLGRAHVLIYIYEKPTFRIGVFYDSSLCTLLQFFSVTYLDWL